MGSNMDNRIKWFYMLFADDRDFGHWANRAQKFKYNPVFQRFVKKYLVEETNDGQ